MWRCVGVRVWGEGVGMWRCGGENEDVGCWG